MAASDRKDEAKATMTTEEIRQSTDVAKMAEILRKQVDAKIPSDHDKPHYNEFIELYTTLSNIIKSQTVTAHSFESLKKLRLVKPPLIKDDEKLAIDLYQRLMELNPILQKKLEAKYPELRNKTIEQIQQLAIDFLNRFNDPYPREIREDITQGPLIKEKAWKQEDGYRLASIFDRERSNPDAIHFEGFSAYIKRGVPGFNQKDLSKYSAEAELPEDFIKILNANKTSRGGRDHPRCQVINNLDVIYSLAQYQLKLFFAKEIILDYLKLYKQGEKPSAESKDAKEVAALNINNLFKCYELALAVKPEKLKPEDAKVIGEILLDLLHNASPGMSFNPDYAKVMASLTNYNDVLLQAMKLLNRAEDKLDAAAVSKAPEKQTTASVQGLDVKDTVVAERTMYIPNNDLFKIHLLMSTYEPDDKEQKNLSVDLDKIIEEKGEELAKNFEKREKLSDFFAKNETWKQLSSYIQKQVASGSKEEFLGNLIKQKLSCEAELDDGKRDKLMQQLQQSVQKEMSGKGFGLWSNSINKDLQELNNAFKSAAPEQPKVRVRLREKH